MLFCCVPGNHKGGYYALKLGGGSTLTVTGLLRVTGSATLLVQGKNTTGPVGGQWLGVGSTIQAGSVQVDAGSQISADAQGYTASEGPGGGVTYYTGGTHGGSGSGNPAPTYGSYLAPIDLGSGGMTYGGAPSNGGGAIRLIVSGALTNNGTITANGGAVIGTGAGAAGGSIYVTTGTLGGAGTFTAGGSTPGGGAHCVWRRRAHRDLLWHEHVQSREDQRKLRRWRCDGRHRGCS